MTIDLFVSGISVVGIIIGLIQVAKKMGLPNKFAPMLSISLGVIFGGIVAMLESDPGNVFVGLACGLMACGLYDQVKNISTGKDTSKK